MTETLQWKRNTRYPSVTRPGVFPRIQEFNDFGEDILENTWFKLNGIDEEEMNKFKFALGTWTQLSRRNRKIKVISADLANSITVVAADEEEAITEPKPNYLPENYVEDIFAWANNIEEAKQGDAVNDGIFQLDGPTAAGYGVGIEGLRKYRKTHGGKWRFMKLDGISKIGWNSYHEYPNADNPYVYLMESRIEGLGITNSPGWYDSTQVGAESPEHAWKVYHKKRTDQIGKGDYKIYIRPNIETDQYIEGEHATGYGESSNGYQWSWRPHGQLITDPDTGLTAFGDWVEKSTTLIQTENQASSDNKYVGLVTKTPKNTISEIEPDDLFLYHEIGSDNYKDISAPLEIYFSLNYLERDADANTLSGGTDVVKYLVLEWGDEEEKMSDQQILDSEFFYVYENDDNLFDAIKYKKLCLIASEAITLSPDEINNTNADRGTIQNHLYIEPGIKTIKTIVFRFDTNGEFLLETSIVYTNIFVADPNQTIQDFNIFGAEDYSVLPLENELEPIIGNIDKRSEYVRSIEKIKNNDLYQSTDYLEKLYADDFLPKVKNDLYGEYAGNIDLGITRVFKKTYNIFDFIGGDALQIINNNFEYPQDSLPLNSSATEILINNGDCVVELNPSNQNNDQIENNGISDEKGILMGDFRLVKNSNQKIKKEDSMQLPKVNTQKKRQAF